MNGEETKDADLAQRIIKLSERQNELFPPMGRSYTRYPISDGYEVLEEKYEGPGVVPETHVYNIVINLLAIDGKYLAKVDVDGKSKEISLTREELAKYGLMPGKKLIKRVYGKPSTERAEIEEEMMKIIEELKKREKSTEDEAYTVGQKIESFCNDLFK